MRRQGAGPQGAVGDGAAPEILGSRPVRSLKAYDPPHPTIVLKSKSWADIPLGRQHAEGCRRAGRWCLVNEVRTDMVNERLTEAAGRPRLAAVLSVLRSPRPKSVMSKPLSTERPTSERARALIASAVRTLEAEASGITTLAPFLTSPCCWLTQLLPG